MNRYLSLVYLYYRACGKKLLIMAAFIPACTALLFFCKTGSTGFDGILPVLIFVGLCFVYLTILLNAVNGRKALKVGNSLCGYTIRRLCISPLSAYITVLIFSLQIVIIFFAMEIASVLLVGKIGFIFAGAEDINTALALEILQTSIGHALIPIGHLQMMVFNVVAIFALSGECAGACYLGWHNGRNSVGIVLIMAPMVYVWGFNPKNSFILLIIMFVAFYGFCTIGDVIFREKNTKGDPFIVNKYSGIIDMDSDDFEEDVRLEANRITDIDKTGKMMSLFKRFMPLGINIEKATYLLISGIVLGVAGNLLFFGKFMIELQNIRANLKGGMNDGSIMMPYFSDLMNNACAGYFVGILLVLLLQIYWNYSYYNKATKSIYVMKRIPDKRKYSMTILVAPAMEMVLIAVIMVINIAVDFGLYLIATPDVALKSDYMLYVLPF